MTKKKKHSGRSLYHVICSAYLFVFLVTTLYNSSSYFLLLLERPPLLESRVGYRREVTVEPAFCQKG